MKRLLRILLLLLIFPIIVKADLQLRNYDEAVGRVNGYINDYSDRSKYLIFNQKYELKNGSNVSNSSFTMGGMISRGEFELTKFKGSTYLEIGKQYWTLSTPTSNRAYKYYVDVTLRTKSEVEQSGVRATEYVKPAVGVSGKGTYSNPLYLKKDT